MSSFRLQFDEEVAKLAAECSDEVGEFFKYACSSKDHLFSKKNTGIHMDGTLLMPEPGSGGLRPNHTHPWNIEDCSVAKVVSVTCSNDGITVKVKLNGHNERIDHLIEHYHIWLLEGAHQKLYEYYSEMPESKIGRLKHGKQGEFLKKVLEYKAPEEKKTRRNKKKS